MAGFGFSPPRPPDRGPLRTRRPPVPRPYQHPPGPAARPPSLALAAGQPVQQPPPDYGAEAMQGVQTQLDPMLRYITEKYGAQAAGVSSALTGLTNSYAGMLSGLAGNVPGIYGPGIKTVSGAAEGINRQLTGLGQSTANTEAAAAAQAGQAAGGQSPDINLAQTGAGAGQAAGAIGQAMIDALQSEQKAAMQYAEKLPGFARLEGDQQLKSALATLSAQMADQLAQTTAQAPQLYYTIYQNLQDRAANDRAFRERVREYNQQENQRKAGIAGPNAPTVAGRQAYWQSAADKRTQQSGDMWVATSTGIRPYDANPSKPGIQRQRTQQGQAADYLNLDRQTSSQVRVTNAQTGQQRARIAQQNANTAASRASTSAAQAQTRENHRHAETTGRLTIAARNATTAQQRAAIASRQAQERARHDRATEQIARTRAKTAGKKKAGSGSTIYGTGP